MNYFQRLALAMAVASSSITHVAVQAKKFAKSTVQINKASGHRNTDAVRQDMETVDDYIKLNLPKLVIKSGGILLYEAITPSVVKDKNFDTNRRITTGVYADQYDWDAHFISRSLLSLNPSRYRQAVQGALLNFLALQSPEGFIPRTVGYDGMKDFPGHHKPFLFQTILLLHQNGLPVNWLEQDFGGYTWSQSFDALMREKNDPAFWGLDGHKRFLRKDKFQPIERLEKYLDFYDTHRKSPDGKSYAWANIVESGIDTTLALRPRVYAPVGDVTEDTIITGSPVPRIAAIDLNVYLYNEFKAAAEVFALLERPRQEQYYLNKAEEIKSNFLNAFWDENDGFFYNRYYRPGGGTELIDIPAWMGFLPLSADGLIDNVNHPEVAKTIIEKHILASDAFWSPHGVRSLSRRSPVQGGDSGRALVPEYWFEAANWNGPVWVLPNIYAINILKKYGYTAQADELLGTIDTLLATDIRQHGMMHEQYSYIDGKPGWAEDFMSWNTLMLLLNDSQKTLAPH
jgi:hypothetical protein